MVVSVAVVLVVGFLIAVGASRHRAASQSSSALPLPGDERVNATAQGPTRLTRFDEDLSRWVVEGLLSGEQASAITAFEVSRAPAPVASPSASRKVPAVAEALGYIGAILAVTGVVLIIVRYWPDLSTGARLGLSGSLALLLGAGGAVVHEAADAALARLRGVLWLASTASAGLFAVVVARTLRGENQRVELAVLVAGIVVSALSGVMWSGRFRPLQELTTFAGAVTAVGAGLRLVSTPGWMGFGVWACGAGLIALALFRRVRTPFIADLVGAAAVVVGGVILTNSSMPTGGPLASASAVALLALALDPHFAHDEVEVRFYSVMGIVAIIQSWPVTLDHFAGEAGLLTGLVVWVLGALALGVAMRARVRSNLLVEWGASLVMLLGAAITQAQFASLAPLLGLMTALGLMALGTRPGGVMLSFVGSVGLLVNVPWLVVRLFPGQVRAPVVIVITGALFVGLAVLLSREKGRLHDVMSGSLAGRHRGPRSPSLRH